MHVKLMAAEVADWISSLMASWLLGGVCLALLQSWLPSLAQKRRKLSAMMETGNMTGSTFSGRAAVYVMAILGTSYLQSEFLHGVTGICSQPVIAILCPRYFETVSDVLSSVRKMEESLKRLKQARRSPATNPVSSSGGMSDDDKIRLQLALDVEHLGEQVPATRACFEGQASQGLGVTPLGPTIEQSQAQLAVKKGVCQEVGDRKGRGTQRVLSHPTAGDRCFSSRPGCQQSCPCCPQS